MFHKINIIIGVVMLLFTNGVFAAKNQNKKVYIIFGSVTGIDSKSNFLTVKNLKESYRFMMNTGTEISEKNKLQLQNFYIGEQVQVKYKKQTFNSVALEIVRYKYPYF